MNDTIKPAASTQAPTAQPAPTQLSEKGFVPTLLLCFFLGAFGIHRFYVGKVVTGVLMLLTLGGLGIWALVDMIIIATGSFKDKHGAYIKAQN